MVLQTIKYFIHDPLLLLDDLQLNFISPSHVWTPNLRDNLLNSAQNYSVCKANDIKFYYQISTDSFFFHLKTKFARIIVVSF